MVKPNYKQVTTGRIKEWKLVLILDLGHVVIRDCGEAEVETKKLTGQADEAIKQFDTQD